MVPRWRTYGGSAIVGVIAATVSAALGFDPAVWQWWAIMGGCILSGWTRQGVG